MSYYAFEGLIPVVHPDAFVHPSAVLIGDVIVGAGVYIGPLASLRGDYGRLILEAGSNLQDGCIMHGYCDTDTIVHENGHIGHGAILHGCVAVSYTHLRAYYARSRTRSCTGNASTPKNIRILRSAVERGYLKRSR